MESDEQLIESINKGDADAFETLYYRYRDWVYNLAWRFTGSQQDSLDVLQETFTYLLNKLPGLKLTASMTTFLYPVVRHIASNIRQKNRRFTSGEENLEATLAKLETQKPAAIDLNLGCPAPEIQHQASGAALFRDFGRLKQVLERIRACYGGTLTVKCRLGDEPEQWRKPFLERLKLFEDCGVHAITVHPRLSTEKLKRRARWREFPWITAQTKLPVVGNGDVRSLRDVQDNRDDFSPLAGLMLGRIVAQKPWIFREFAGLPAPEIHYAEVWERLYRYTLEDLPPERALGRMKEFTFYYSGNFVFGHELFKAGLKARNMVEIREFAMRFLDSNPQIAC